MAVLERVVTAYQVTVQHAPQAPTAPRAARPSGAPATDRQLEDQINQAVQDANRAVQEAGENAVVQIGPDGRVTVNGRPALPGSIPVGRLDTSHLIPPQAVDISIAFFVMCAVMVVGWPLARAFGRRIERRGDVPAAPTAMAEQLQRIEQAVEAISIEVERISESQRFMARVQSQGAPEPMALPTQRR